MRLNWRSKTRWADDRTLRGDPAKLRKAGPRPKVLFDCPTIAVPFDASRPEDLRAWYWRLESSDLRQWLP